MQLLWLASQRTRKGKCESKDTEVTRGQVEEAGLFYSLHLFKLVSPSMHCFNSCLVLVIRIVNDAQWQTLNCIACLIWVYTGFDISC